MASLLLLRPAASGGANRIRFPSIISSFRRGLSSHIDAHDRANKEAIRDGLSRRRLGINKFTDGKISELQANKAWAGVR
uniref:Uncharacterized protein n=1 Tax=Oryza rufipogon TaxID=4529 RepID=A0A0E0QDD5_ORYRU